MGYWEDRYAEGQAALLTKSEKEIEKQMSRYYRKAAKSVIKDFESTYDHLLATLKDGREATPADLYKLEKYWEMVGKIRKTLYNLADIESEWLIEQFQATYERVYNGLNLPVDIKFSTLSEEAVEQLITSVWCADGKSWKARVWDNKAKLIDTLNDELINTILTGKTTNDLKAKLQEQFNATYYEANRLVKTELKHIQVKAAEQRYKDSGIEYVEVWADKDERRCKVCGKLHKTKYRIGETTPIPAHPNCRCSVLPVIE